MSDESKVIESLSLAVDAARGRVAVRGRLRPGLEYPVVELSLLSQAGREVAATIIVDAGVEFDMTLHPRGVDPGVPLTLRVDVLENEEKIASEEYSFVYEEQ